MKKQLATLVLAILMGVLGFAVSGVAVAGNGPPSPPGQDECTHGNSGKPCKEDPQPEKGKDCEAHGNHGGVNEDHCKSEDTTPTETTPTTTTPTTTTPTETTPTGTTPTGTTPQETVPSEGGSNPSTPSSTVSAEPSTTPATEQSATTQPKPKIVGKPPVAASAAKTEQTAALDVAADEPKPTTQAQQAPLTL
jgi:hypothetical protein